MEEEKCSVAVNNKAVENLRTDMQDCLKLKLQAKVTHPSVLGGLETSSQDTFDLPKQ